MSSRRAAGLFMSVAAETGAPRIRLPLSRKTPVARMQARDASPSSEHAFPAPEKCRAIPATSVRTRRTRNAAPEKHPEAFPAHGCECRAAFRLFRQAEKTGKAALWKAKTSRFRSRRPCPGRYASFAFRMTSSEAAMTRARAHHCLAESTSPRMRKPNSAAAAGSRLMSTP